MFFFSSWYIENVITKHKFILTSTELCLSFTKVKHMTTTTIDKHLRELTWKIKSTQWIQLNSFLSFECHVDVHIFVMLWLPQWHSRSMAFKFCFYYTTTISWHFSTNLKITLIFLLFFHIYVQSFLFCPIIYTVHQIFLQISYSVNDRQMTWKLNNSCHNDLLFMVCSEARWRFHDY